MKMIYGGVPVNSMKLKHYEISTNDCDMVASDLQAGKTGVAKGRKITGTGKSFEFACYGDWTTNLPYIVPAVVNVVQVGSVDYAIKTVVPIYNTNLDFTIAQKIVEVTIDGIVYPVTASVQNGMLTIFCDHTINIQLFFGKDNYR